jgi:transcriptional regulator with XRE-family HTH domain
MIFSIINDQNHHLRFYLGRYLKQKRLSRNLAITDIAEKVHLSERQYRSLEEGKVKISMENFETIFPLLALDYNELSEIYKIAQIAYANSITKELSENYPQ